MTRICTFKSLKVKITRSSLQSVSILAQLLDFIVFLFLIFTVAPVLFFCNRRYTNAI